jgi:hypothetical protein
MVCGKCGKEGIEAGDAFCRHCGFSLATQTSVGEGGASIAEKKAVKARNLNAGKGLELLGAAIFVAIALIAFVAAPLIGWPDVRASVLPWISGAVLLASVAIFFVGYELSRTH